MFLRKVTPKKTSEGGEDGLFTVCAPSHWIENEEKVEETSPEINRIPSANGSSKIN